jgi:hypothetical protein
MMAYPHKEKILINADLYSPLPQGAARPHSRTRRNPCRNHDEFQKLRTRPPPQATNANLFRNVFQIALPFVADELHQFIILR